VGAGSGGLNDACCLARSSEPLDQSKGICFRPKWTSRPPDPAFSWIPGPKKLDIQQVFPVGLSLSFSFGGLGTTVTEAVGIHIHEGPSGANGPVRFALFGDAEIIPSGLGGCGWSRLALNETEVATLLASGYYFNVHSTGNPTGELRGQLTAVAAPLPDACGGGVGTGVPDAGVGGPAPLGPTAGTGSAAGAPPPPGNGGTRAPAVGGGGFFGDAANGGGAPSGGPADGGVGEAPPVPVDGTADGEPFPTTDGGLDVSADGERAPPFPDAGPTDGSFGGAASTPVDGEPFRTADGVFDGPANGGGAPPFSDAGPANGDFDGAAPTAVDGPVDGEPLPTAGGDFDGSTAGGDFDGPTDSGGEPLSPDASPADGGAPRSGPTFDGLPDASYGPDANAGVPDGAAAPEATAAGDEGDGGDDSALAGGGVADGAAAGGDAVAGAGGGGGGAGLGADAPVPTGAPAEAADGGDGGASGAYVPAGGGGGAYAPAGGDGGSSPPAGGEGGGGPAGGAGGDSLADGAGGDYSAVGQTLGRTCRQSRTQRRPCGERPLGGRGGAGATAVGNSSYIAAAPGVSLNHTHLWVRWRHHPPTLRVTVRLSPDAAGAAIATVTASAMLRADQVGRSRNRGNASRSKRSATPAIVKVTTVCQMTRPLSAIMLSPSAAAHKQSV